MSLNGHHYISALTPPNGMLRAKVEERNVPVQRPEPEPEAKSFLQKAVSYARAEVSLLTQFISEEDVRKRLDACRSCPSLEPSKEPDQVGWCKACGCGKKARAELTIKTRMPAATCPKGKWP